MNDATGTRWVCDQCGRLNRQSRACVDCGAPAPVEADSPAGCPNCAHAPMNSLGEDLRQCAQCGHLEWTGVVPVLPHGARRPQPPDQSAAEPETPARRRGRVRKVRRRKGRKQRQILALGFFVTFLLAVAVTAFVVVQRQEEGGFGQQVANAERNELVARVPWLENSTLMNDVSHVVASYLQATEADELAEVVIDGAALQTRIKAWLSSTELTPWTDVGLPMRPETFTRVTGDWWRLRVEGTGPTGEVLERDLVLRIEPASVGVDWAATEGFGEAPWDVMLLRRPRQPLEMRVRARPATVILEADEYDRRLRRVELHPGRGRGVPVVALIEPDSLLARQLEEAGAFKSGQDGAEARLSVRLSFPAQRRLFTNGREQVVLEEILRADWLSFADQESALPGGGEAGSEPAGDEAPVPPSPMPEDAPGEESALGDAEPS